jgi:hypothetical protein
MEILKEKDPLSEVIEMPFFKSRNSILMDKNPNPEFPTTASNAIYIIAESSISHWIVISLVFIDFLVNQALLLSVLFTGFQDVSYISTLNLNSSALWITLSSISIAINTIFLLELFVRVYGYFYFKIKKCRWEWEFFTDAFNVFDSLVILALIPLKLTLSVKLVFVTNVIVLLRLGRIYKLVQEMKFKHYNDLQLKLDSVLRDKENLWIMERNKANQLEELLEVANSKLEKLLGERPVEKPLKLV